MPVKVRKVKGGYSVSTPHGTKAKKTTKKKAKAQERLLNAVENSDWRPTGKKAKSKKTKARRRHGGSTVLMPSN